MAKLSTTEKVLMCVGAAVVEEVDSGKTTKFPGTIFTREDHVLVGWSSVDGGELEYAINATTPTITEPVTYYPVWEKCVYSVETAYDYFCNEFENILFYICGLKDTTDDIGSHNSEAKTMLRSAIIAAVNIIFVNFCFSELNNIDPTEDDPDDEYITIE